MSFSTSSSFTETSKSSCTAFKASDAPSPGNKYSDNVILEFGNGIKTRLGGSWSVNFSKKERNCNYLQLVAKINSWADIQFSP